MQIDEQLKEKEGVLIVDVEDIILNSKATFRLPVYHKGDDFKTTFTEKVT